MKECTVEQRILEFSLIAGIIDILKNTTQLYIQTRSIDRLVN